ncbi:MAG: prephenate dehydrogenase/arogenate dehydrogenase family protein [Candidatus Abyssobacteria bacterium SURF_17]|uniref:Prephenate dehydrogenase/arogenate dehydrogenase family protein n=1 Tax=Candidatus Abyssobacteria bacterium SURF_17 TaxID=2093361 RepID=A0A419F889_9BACT|nr:MAG: prephenate dehydrogenase/arogenate dehydrogenase family protein [Candidatus Abyssubacteria bacterium SURF_17]
MSTYFDKVTIIGVGLIGGSLGLGLKAKHMCGKVVGIGRSPTSVEKGLRMGAIDEAGRELTEAAKGADLILICTPVGSVASIVEQMESSLKEGCFITDVGSTKGSIVRAVEELARVGARFVGSHPLAGSEKKGVAHASASLFEGATVFLTPTARTTPAVAETIKEMWGCLGGNVVELTPSAHDRILARTSHLPHIMAALLVSGLNALDKGCNHLVGKGFLDTTRIASSDPEMWADICLANSQEIREALAALGTEMEQFDRYLSAHDHDEVFAFFNVAKALRDSLNRNKPNE